MAHEERCTPMDITEDTLVPVSFHDLDLDHDEQDPMTVPITLVSRENVEFVVPRKAALLSGTIASMLGYTKEGEPGMGGLLMSEGLSNRVHFREIDTQTLHSVVQYMHYKLKYQNTPRDVPVPEFRVDKETILDVMMAAHFLDL